MRKISELAGAVGAKLRDRSRSVKWRVLEIARAARGKAPPSREKLKAAYGRLLRATSRVVGQAKRFSREIGEGVKRSAEIVRQAAMEGYRRVLDVMVPLVQQVIPPGQSPYLPRRSPQQRQNRQPVRPIDRGNSQRQGCQADRVWQAGEAAGGGEADRHRL